MVRIITEHIIDDDKKYIEAAGLSTDTKPTEDLITGSVFIEVDTGLAFFFDEESGDWYELGGGE